MGTLYIVATPIGNLQDITLRAIETFSKVDFILCEDTRTTQILLNSIKKKFESFQTQAKLVSYYEQNEKERISEILELIKKDFNFVLVSDAGTPTVSDPGFKLVREVVNAGGKVISIPGPSSVISALVSSGLPTDKFMFVGFLPKKPGHRINQLNDIKSVLALLKQTVIIFESPYRLVKTLEEIKSVFGEIDIVVARELTKVYEEVRKEQITDCINHFEKVKPKGEIVILFNLE
jgi:16S rRNA (cytidine1402-2'-O)-methyltransferase